MTDHAELLTIARQAINMATTMLLTHGPGEVRTKGDRDLVTDLDIRIQHEVQDFLARETPSIGFLGEEQEGSGEASLDDGPLWVLDPIDGTSNFAHGIPLYATQLALVKSGSSTVAVISAPALNLSYEATKGQGAYSDGRRLSVSNTSELRHAIVSIGDYATGPDAAEKNKQRFASTQALAHNVERVRMFGSAALDLAFVAEGRTDACVIHANKPWDTAAGTLLAAEAGAFLVDLSGMPYTWSSASAVAVTPTIAEAFTGICSGGRS